MDLQGRHIFTVRYDEDMVRDAVRTFIWRRALLEHTIIWITSVLLVISSVYFLIWGDAGWLAGVMLIVAVVPAIIVAVMWRNHHRDALGRFHRLTTRQADITMDAEGLEIRSDLGKGRLSWAAVTEVWERPRSFMIFSDTTTFNTLPRDGMPEDVQSFLRSRFVQV
jgi:hypothetical protein